MYDAVTRSTYAELVKTAETKMSAPLNAALVKVASRIPAVRDALVNTASQTSTEGGN